MENQTISPSYTSFDKPTSLNEQPSQNTQRIKLSLLVKFFIAFIVSGFLFGLGGYYIGSLVNKTYNKQRSVPIFPETSVAPTPSLSITGKTETSDLSIYTYNTFSISYPKGWNFTSINNNVNFPLKDRLIFDDEVIALNKDGIYLIINISKAGQVESGGFFIYDKEYEEFVDTHDKVIILGSTFYLTKNHQSISELEEAHSGPASWGALKEYIPEKLTGSGKVYRGYEQIIKRNGYMYNFIIVAQEQGITPPTDQSEIKTILESIKW